MHDEVINALIDLLTGRTTHWPSDLSEKVVGKVGTLGRAEEVYKRTKSENYTYLAFVGEGLAGHGWGSVHEHDTVHLDNSLGGREIRSGIYHPWSVAGRFITARTNALPKGLVPAPPATRELALSWLRAALGELLLSTEPSVGPTHVDVWMNTSHERVPMASNKAPKYFTATAGSRNGSTHRFPTWPHSFNTLGEVVTALMDVNAFPGSNPEGYEWWRWARRLSDVRVVSKEESSKINSFLVSNGTRDVDVVRSLLNGWHTAKGCTYHVLRYPNRIVTWSERTANGNKSASSVTDYDVMHDKLAVYLPAHSRPSGGTSAAETTLKDNVLSTYADGLTLRVDLPAGRPDVEFVFSHHGLESGGDVPVILEDSDVPLDEQREKAGALSGAMSNVRELAIRMVAEAEVLANPIKIANMMAQLEKAFTRTEVQSIGWPRVNDARKALAEHLKQSPTQRGWAQKVANHANQVSQAVDAWELSQETE